MTVTADTLTIDVDVQDSDHWDTGREGEATAAYSPGDRVAISIRERNDMVSTITIDATVGPHGKTIAVRPADSAFIDDAEWLPLAELVAHPIDRDGETYALANAGD